MILSFFIVQFYSRENMYLKVTQKQRPWKQAFIS
jgi:hypothetical protein